MINEKLKINILKKMYFSQIPTKNVAAHILRCILLAMSTVYAFASAGLQPPWVHGLFSALLDDARSQAPAHANKHTSMPPS